MDAYNYIFYHLIKVSIASHHRLNNPILWQRNFKKYQPTQPIAGSNRAASKFDTRAHGRARMAAAAAMMSDPFEKTNLLDKCGFLYPNFDRKKKHVMAKPCAHWLISAPIHRFGSTWISRVLDALAEHGELRATKRVGPDKRWKAKPGKPVFRPVKSISCPFAVMKIQWVLRTMNS